MSRCSVQGTGGQNYPPRLCTPPPSVSTHGGGTAITGAPSNTHGLQVTAADLSIAGFMLVAVPTVVLRRRKLRKQRA